ncbi:T9SS type A sorting domain-containing protein [Flavobacterium sp. PS2]|uniref:T9SS type A sorting domain-containing protein n=1 Tax=Flavobacterium sp. PS2 TaxID=3384157 RepID=UPI00390CBA56
MNTKLLFLNLFLLFSFNFSHAQFSLVKNFSETPSNFHVHNGRLYFSATETNLNNNELWVYDANVSLSSSNPKLLADLNNDLNISSYPRNFTSYNGKLFFSDNTFLYSYNSEEPISQTNPLKIGNKGNGLVVYNNKLYYEEATEYPKSWLWVYDDTQSISTANPKKLNTNSELNSTSLGFRFKSIVFNNKLYYCGDNLNDKNYELYVYDSKLPISNTNPKKINDINAGANPSTPQGFIIFNNKLYFSADDGTGEELWSYDEISSPIKAYDLDPSRYGGYFQDKTLYNSKMYFSGHTNLGTELFSYDGISTVELVADINLGTEFSIPKKLTVYENKLFFNAANGTQGRELWYYDSNIPSSSTNPKIIDLFNGPESGMDLSSDLIEYNGILYFSGKTSNTNIGLFALKNNNLGVINYERKLGNILYPNPTSGIINIESPEEIIDQLNIINSLGQEISSLKPNNKKQVINLKNKGLYFIQIKTKNGIETQKVIVN